MITPKIKSLLYLFLSKRLLFGVMSPLICTTFCTLPFSAQALPERYTIISREVPPDFYFYEDQPWVHPPKKIYFNEFLAEKKVVILHLWATSCPSCISELKQLEKAAVDYMNQPITFVALSLNDPRSGVLRNYFNRIPYTHLKPYHKASSTRPAIKGLPTTLFFNKNGQLIGRIEGAAKWQGDEMKRLLQRLMNEELPKDTPFNLKGFFDPWITSLKNLFS